MSNESSRVQTGLTKQVDDVLTADTDWITLANELDVSRYALRDGHREWSSSLPFRPMFLAYLWATVERESLSGIPERLSDRPELARAFGFEMGELPSESSCKPVRLESRFGTLQTVVESGAERIRALAAERGAPIGNDLLKTADGENEQSLSNRTVQRLLRKKGHEVLDELKSVAIPSISLPRPDDAIYDDDELLVLEAIASIKQQAAHGSGQKLGDVKNPDPDIDDPFYEDGPSGETLLEALKQMSIEEIATVLNFALRKTYTRAKPRIRELEHGNGSRFGTRADYPRN